MARELVWAAMVNHPAAMVSYSEHSRIPLPAVAIRASAPLIAAMASRVNKTNDDVARADLKTLPGQLETVDGWIADGTIGDAQHPNAADLQLASTIRLMLTLADVRPLIEGRPCEALARELFPAADGEMPAGSLKR